MLRWLSHHIIRFSRRRQPARDRGAPRASIDAVMLEDRVMYSATPLPVPDVAGLVENADPASQIAAFEPLENTDSRSNDPLGLAENAQPSEVQQRQVEHDEQVLRLELVFVDQGAADYQQLIDDLLLDEDPLREIEIYLLDAQRSGIDQITEVLSSYDQVDAVHLVTHGTEGQIKLGDSWVNAGNLAEHAESISTWSDSLRAGSDLMIYGCDLAASETGRQLVQALGALCDCDVAASVDQTGHTSLDGDWDLEHVVGRIETQVAFSTALQQDWVHVLPNSPPVLGSLDGGTLNYRIGDPLTVIDTDATVTDPDSPDFDTGSLTIDFSANGTANDRLIIDESGDFVLQGGDVRHKPGGSPTTIGTWSGGTDGSTPLVITFNADATPAIVEELVRSIGYQNVSATPSELSRSVRFVLTDGDGGISNTATVTVNVINPIPQLDLDPDDSVEPGLDYRTMFSAGAGPVDIVDIDALITDGDSPNLNQVEITITNNSDKPNEFFVYDLSGTGISATWNSNAGRLRLTGDRPVSEYVQVLRTLQYNNTAASPDATTRTITFVARDTEANLSPTATSYVHIQETSGLWLTTDGDVPTGTGTPTLSGWNSTEVIEISDPNLRFEPTAPAGTTDGTFSSIHDFGPDMSLPESLASLHFVSRDILVGGGANTFQLEFGDLLFSTDSDTTMGGVTIAKGDIAVFEPNDPSDYSLGGTYSILLHDVAGGAKKATGLSLVEQDTLVGDTVLKAGTFLFSANSIGQDAVDVFQFVPFTVGFNTTVGATHRLIEGDDVDNAKKVEGIDLVESTTIVGGTTLQSGWILLTAKSGQTGVGSGPGGIDPTEFDIFYLDVNTTTKGSGVSNASAAILFDGSDAGIQLTSLPENINGLTLVSTEGASINGTFVNTPPTITSSTTPSMAENTTTAVALTATDPEAPPQVVTLGITGGADQLLFTINGSDELEFLAAPDFETPGDANSDNVYEVEITANDGYGGTDVQLVSVTVTDVNEPPSINLSTGAVLYTENDGQQVIDSALTVSDVDDVNLESATVRILVGYASGEDVLAFTDQLGITGSWNSGTGILTLTGTSSVANYETALRTITYENTSENPTTGNRTVSFQVSDGAASSSGSRTITVSAINDAPVLSNIAGDTLSYSTGSGALVIDQTAAALVGDVDSADFNGGNLTVQFTSGSNPVEDVLSIRNQGMGAGQIGFDGLNVFYGGIAMGTAGGGVLGIPLTISLNANATPIATSALLQNVTFENINVLLPTPGSRNVRFTVNDGDGDTSLNHDATVNVNGSNTAPTITSSSTPSIAENTTTAVALTASDPEAPPQVVTFGITGGADQLLFTINGSNELDFVAAPDFESPGDANSDNVYEVEITANDGNGGTDVQLVSVTVTDVNESPTITSSSTPSMVENTTTAVALTASDPEAPPQVVTFGITGGADQLLFTINGSNELEFVAAPDFESPGDANSDNVYEVEITANDGNGGTDVQLVSVTVTDVNEPPSINLSPGAVLYTENDGQQVIDSALTVSDVDDVNLESATVRILVGYASGEDVLAFTDQLGITGSWNSGTGILTLTGTSSVANYETALRTITYENTSEDPTTGNRTVSFQVSDGSANASASRIIAVSATNDAPVLSNIAGDTLNYSTGSGALVIDQAAAALVGDVDSADFNGGNLTVQFTSGSNPVEDVLSIRNQGMGAGQIGFDGLNVFYGGIAIGTAGGGVLGIPLTMSLNANATPIATGALLQNVTFENINVILPTAGARNVRFTVNDGDGDTSLNHDATVNVNATNTDPTITSSSTPSMVENTTTAVALTASDPEAPPQVVTFGITGGADQLLFTINGSNELEFVAAPDFETPGDANSDNVYEVEITANDGNGGTDVQLVSVTVTDANESPTITSSSTPSMVENTTTAVALTASDPEAPPQVVTFGITGGADQLLFTINGSNELEFVAAPDFESPGDANSDNVYEVEITANDGNGGTDVQLVSVTVTDANESPTITSSSTPSMVENTTTAVALTASDPEAPPQVVTFGITGGADQLLFTINGSNELEFVAAPDFETPSDANSDNVYEVEITANDGNGGTDVQLVSVTVTNVNEAPVITSSNTANVVENSTFVMTLTSTDVDGGAPLYSIIGGTDSALFSIDGATGALKFVAAPNFELPLDANLDNTYEVQVRVADGLGGTDQQLIAVSVTDTNDAPTAGNDSFGVVEGIKFEAAVPGVLLGDADEDGDTLTVSLLSGPSEGTLVLRADGSFDYTAEIGSSEVVVFSYQVDDGNGGTAVAFVTMEVAGVGALPPIAPPDPDLEPPPEAEPPPEVDPPVELDLPQLEPTANTDPVFTGTRQRDLRANRDAFEVSSVQFASVAPLQSIEFGAVYERSAVKTAVTKISSLLPDPVEVVIEQFAETFDIGLDDTDLAALEEALQRDVATTFVAAGVLAGASGVLTAGYVLWLIRGGWLITSLLAQMPAWRLVDPLVVLEYLDDEDSGELPDNEEDDSLESLLERHDRNHGVLEESTPDVENEVVAL